jgi:hypothetical protein
VRELLATLRERTQVVTQDLESAEVRNRLIHRREREGKASSCPWREQPDQWCKGRFRPATLHRRPRSFENLVERSGPERNWSRRRGGAEP